MGRIYLSMVSVAPGEQGNYECPMEYAFYCPGFLSFRRRDRHSGMYRDQQYDETQAYRYHGHHQYTDAECGYCHGYLADAPFHQPWI